MTATSEWGEEIKNDVTVRMGLVILSGDGMSFHCYLCDKAVKSRHPYSPASYLGKAGHIHNDKHKKKLDVKLCNMRREKQRVADGKQPEKAIKYHAQSTIMGFFGSRSTSTTTSRSTTFQSTTSRTSTSAAVAGKFYISYVSTVIPIINMPLTFVPTSCLGRSTTASIATGCTGVIPLKVCKPVGSAYNLTIVHKYGRLDPGSDYRLKEIGENTLVYNLYHNNCTCVGMHLVGKKQGDIRCNVCMKMWTERSSRIKTRMKGRIDNLKRAESLLLQPNLTPENANSMRDFSFTGAQSLNDNGQRLKEMVKECLQCEYMYICMYVLFD